MSNLKVIICFTAIAFISAYDIGVTHNYKYETSVMVSEECGEGAEPVGHKLVADVQLTSVWQDPKDPLQKLLKIQVSGAKLLVSKQSSFEDRETQLQKASKSDSFFLLKRNKVEDFLDDPSEHIALRNLKRSVASLVQLQKKDGEEKVSDVSGTCDVFYKVEGKTVRRSKFNCHHPLQDTVLSQAIGVRSLSVHHSTGIDCDLKDSSSNIITKCMATERMKTFSNLWKKSSICVEATTLFSLEGISDNKDLYKNKDYNSVIKEIKQNTAKLTEGNLLAISKKDEQEKTKNVVDFTNSFKESIKTSNLAKLKSVSAFFKMLPAFRSASKEDILKILKNKKFSSILPQIMDLLAAGSTESSMEAVFSFFKDEKAYNEVFERYLISLSVTPRPQAFIVQGVKSFLEKGSHHEKIETSLVTTLGALIGTYAKTSDHADGKVIQDIVGYLQESLKKCSSNDCTLSRLRCLRNAAQPKSIPLLLQYALKGGKPALEALFAVRNIQSSQLSKESQDQLLKVLHQIGAQQDRSTRSLAAEILLRGHVEDSIIRNVLECLSDQSDPEFSTFVASKIVNLMNEDKELRSRILRILPEKEIGYYYSLSQKGKSSLFKRQLIGTEDLNITYGIEMELLEGGLMKRSSFDVDFETHDKTSNLLSVGMFAEGMAALAGGEASPDEEGADPTAGMELSLLGTSLRPYVFFSGTSELMGHAWAGTASEPTPALQGIFSVSDDHRVIILHNGMVLRLELKGALSTDLSAAIQISLWNRNAQTQVKSAAALLVRGSAIVDANVVESRGEYLFYSQSSLDFSTDLEFYEPPFKMCTQMENPDVVFRYDFQKSFEVTGTKYSFKKTKKRKRFIPRRSYALHQTNNDLCRIMKSG